MTQRRKNIMLVVGLVLLFIIAYQFSFSKTFNLQSEISKLEAQGKSYRSAPKQLAKLKQQEKQFDEILTKNNVRGNSLQNNILKVLNTLSEIHNYKIIEFKEPHQYTEEATNKITTTYDFTIEGGYKGIIETLYALEQQYSFGNVVNIDFNRKKNYRTNKKYLQCTILLQRVN
ncbi:hypothetical protein [Aquimarina rhabdastrellae]